MTRDEIAQMMQDSSGLHWGDEAHFQRFAELIATVERLACAKICYLAGPCDGTVSTELKLARAIRARGKA